jgi:pyridoxine kinase
MQTVLLISSQVAAGRVGLRAGVPVLERLGLNTITIPTVLLAHHPGHGPGSRQVRSHQQLSQEFDALFQRGFLGQVSAIITGYFTDAKQVAFACSAITQARTVNNRVVVLVDPIMGDEKRGLYVPERVAEAIGSDLVGLADITTPNLFELRRITQRKLVSLPKIAEAGRFLAPEVVVTSAQKGAMTLDTLVLHDADAQLYRTVRAEPAPQAGTGDVFAALYLSRRLAGSAPGHAAALASASVAHIMRSSVGAVEMNLIANLDAALSAAPAQRVHGPRTESDA